MVAKADKLHLKQEPGPDSITHVVLLCRCERCKIKEVLESLSLYGFQRAPICGSGRILQGRPVRLLDEAAQCAGET